MTYDASPDDRFAALAAMAENLKTDWPCYRKATVTFSRDKNDAVHVAIDIEVPPVASGSLTITVTPTGRMLQPAEPLEETA